MSIRYPILILMVFTSIQTSFGQKLLDQRFSFQIKKSSISDVLLALSNEVEIDIAYSSRFFEKDEEISLRVRDTRLEDILLKILQKTNVSYKSFGQQIILYQKPPPETLRYTISGILSDKESGEKLIGASVYALSHQKGTTTNEYGFYSITLPKGFVELQINYLGSQEKSHKINLTASIRLDLALTSVVELEEVIVRPSPINQSNNSIPMAVGNELLAGYQSVSPDLGGEKDLLRATHLLAGVQTGAEGLGGIFVRGNNSGQNLMMLDGAPIYNPSHLLGMFSIYDFGAVRDAKLLTGFFPARYGGRVSSVMDVRTKDGNRNKWKADVGVGLMTARASVEGPILNKKGSLLISARTTHTDFLTKPILKKAYFSDSDSLNKQLTDLLGQQFIFFDFNAKFNLQLSPKDQIFISFYHGGDELFGEGFLAIDESDEDEISTLDVDVSNIIEWGNTISTLRWNHLFNDRLFLNTSLSYSQYNFNSSLYANVIETEIDRIDRDTSIDDYYNFLKFLSRIRDYSFQSNFEYTPSTNHSLRFGTGFTLHSLKTLLLDLDFYLEDTDDLQDEYPGLESFDQESISEYFDPPFVSGLEGFMYLENEFSLSDHWQFNTGLRLSSFSNKEDLRLHLEPRLMARFMPDRHWQFTGGISKMVQYLHLISPGGFSLPSDIWTMTSATQAPQTIWQSELSSIFKAKKGWSFQVDAYYKKMNNLPYIENNLVLSALENETFNENISSISGTAYGLEASIKKEQGKTGGWINYSWAKSTRQGDQVNLGNRYDFIQDRRHFFKLFFYHKFNSKWSVGANFLLNSNTPYIGIDSDITPNTPSLVDVNQNGFKNEYRQFGYHRLDLNLTYLLKAKKASHTFKLGIYNVYDEDNTAFHRVQSYTSSNLQAMPVQLLGRTPSLYYELKF